ncbi:ArsC family reductase [Parasulfuritortus cantonensis]|uniref:ArsC family reductase n=1 Tax=Parasulfuritortus cantonensis TaxID=2528202 RepID=A0A4V2NVX6_9PROT|nr:ArsC family reductase [Parasulfuritortus cantonensis]TCJ15162.1 ArsC family reductase [Parasulfuritortus cantonensis]
MKVYGIPNCNTVKKARDWLAAHGLDYEFHDYKKQGVPEALMKKLLKAHGHETLINRKGPTWRKLPDAVKDGVRDAESAYAVMAANSSVIKRPIVERDGHYLFGFDEAAYADFFK